jgi:hypothetical protein
MKAANLQKELQRVAETAIAIDVRQFEEAARARVATELIPAITSVLADGISVLGRILEHYETTRNEAGLIPSTDAVAVQGHGEHFYEEIESLMSTASGTGRIADIAFMARWELERKQQGLREIPDQDDPWKVIAECGSARRRLVKSATAVALAVAEHEGIPTALEASYVTELKRSLETRRIYAIFRRRLREAGPFQVHNARACLRAGGTAIATMVGRDVYEDLRVSDRIQLRRLQRRILEWLRGDDGFDTESGRRLWGDLETCSDLLLQVNHRAELCQHDEKSLHEVLEELADEDQERTGLPAHLLPRIELLLGRDPVIDELIGRVAETTVEEWLFTLSQLRRALVRNDEASAEDGLSRGVFAGEKSPS